MSFFRAMAFSVAFFLLPGIAGTVDGAGASELRMQVARACGADSFDKIGALRYTFNVLFNGKTVSRSWIWDMEGDRVTVRQPGEAEPFSYSRAALALKPEERVLKADAEFINDQYWLLFPLHLAWDTGATVTMAQRRPMPIGEGMATCVTVTYPPTGGYTPGDAFDLFLNDSNRVVQWAYRRGNAAKPSRIAKWEGYREVGPLRISLERPGADSTFRVWFTDVAVKLKGSDAWISAR